MLIFGNPGFGIRNFKLMMIRLILMRQRSPSPRSFFLSEVNSELTDACLELQFLSGRDEASYVIPLHLPFLDIEQRLSSSLVPLKPWLENMALGDLNKEIVFIPSRNVERRETEKLFATCFSPIRRALYPENESEKKEHHSSRTSHPYKFYEIGRANPFASPVCYFVLLIFRGLASFFLWRWNDLVIEGGNLGVRSNTFLLFSFFRGESDSNPRI